MSKSTTILVVPDTDEEIILAVRPQKWSDEQWAELVERNRTYYGVDLEEREWEYAE